MQVIPQMSAAALDEILSQPLVQHAELERIRVFRSPRLLVGRNLFSPNEADSTTMMSDILETHVLVTGLRVVNCTDHLRFQISDVLIVDDATEPGRIQAWKAKPPRLFGPGARVSLVIDRWRESHGEGLVEATIYGFALTQSMVADVARYLASL